MSLPLDFQFSQWNTWRQMCIPKNTTRENFQLRLHQVDKEFDLVTITEQFDLSLLLLRRKLCWDISDMLYIPLKKADYELNMNADLVNISKLDSWNQRYEKLNPNAYLLYNHFNQTFWDLTTKTSPDLQEELLFFKQLKQKTSEYCSKYIGQIVKNASMFLQTSKSAFVLHIPASKWGKSRILDPIHCAMMKLHKYTFNYISVSKFKPRVNFKTVT